MTANAIRTGLDTAGGVIQPGGGEGVYVEGYVIGVTGDSVAPHGLPPHDAAVMTGGSSFFTVNGIPVTLGNVDSSSCGHLSESDSFVDIIE